MKNSLILLFAVVAVAAVAAAGLLLFSGSRPADVSLEPIERPAASRTDTSEAVIEGGTSLKKSASTTRERKKPAIEEIKPSAAEEWRPLDVVLHVLDLKTQKAVPSENVSFRVFQNDIRIPALPQATGRPGVFSFGRPIPGRYRFEARAGSGRLGYLSLDVEPGARYDRKIFVGKPSPLEIRVLRASTKNPIVGALVSASTLISRGTTDERGLFRSKRSVVTDPGLTVAVSKRGYFTSLARPFSAKKPTGRKKVIATVFLRPLGGAAVLSGLVVDQNETPLAHWVLRLTPLPGKGSSPGTVRFMETTTNHEGAFRFESLAAGEYILEGLLQTWTEPNAPDFPPLFSKNITIPGGQSLENQKIVCTLSPLRVRGVILRADTLEPVPGVRISCNGSHAASAGGPGGPADTLHFEETATDSKGFFAIDRAFLPTEINILLQRTGLRLTPQGGRFEVFRLPHASGAMTNAISALMRNAPIRVWLRFGNTIELRGNVTDVTGLPIKGVIAEANPLADVERRRFRTITNKNGDFVIPGLFAGSWNVKVDLPAGPSLEKFVTLTAGARPQSLSFQASGDCRLEGVVDLKEAAYFPRITIRGESFAIENKRLRRSGRFAFAYLPPGKTFITVESYTSRRFEEKSLEIRKKEVTLQPGTTATVNL